MNVDAALERYLSNPDVSRWLFSTEPVTEVTQRHLQECFVFSVGIGNTKLQLPQSMDLQEMLIVTSTSDSFILGVIWGFGQPHLLSQTPLLPGMKPIARRFAIDLSIRDALEFMEFDIFRDGQIIVGFRRFLQTRDTSIPCSAIVSLHDPSGISHTLGPMKMRATLIESPACPACSHIGTDCHCHFTNSHEVDEHGMDVVNAAPFAPVEREIESWDSLISLFMRKTRIAMYRFSLSNIIENVGAVEIASYSVPVINAPHRGNSEYINLLRRKAVHGLGVNVVIPRADTFISSTNAVPDFNLINDFGNSNSAESNYFSQLHEQYHGTKKYLHDVYAASRSNALISASFDNFTQNAVTSQEINLSEAGHPISHPGAARSAAGEVEQMSQLHSQMFKHQVEQLKRSLSSSPTVQRSHQTQDPSLVNNLESVETPDATFTPVPHPVSNSNNNLIQNRQTRQVPPVVPQRKQISFIQQPPQQPESDEVTHLIDGMLSAGEGTASMAGAAFSNNIGDSSTRINSNFNSQNNLTYNDPQIAGQYNPSIIASTNLAHSSYPTNVLPDAEHKASMADAAFNNHTRDSSTRINYNYNSQNNLYQNNNNLQIAGQFNPSIVTSRDLAQSSNPANAFSSTARHPVQSQDFMLKDIDKLMSSSSPLAENGAVSTANADVISQLNTKIDVQKQSNPTVFHSDDPQDIIDNVLSNPQTYLKEQAYQNNLEQLRATVGITGGSGDKFTDLPEDHNISSNLNYNHEPNVHENTYETSSQPTSKSVDPRDRTNAVVPVANQGKGINPSGLDADAHLADFDRDAQVAISAVLSVKRAIENDKKKVGRRKNRTVIPVRDDPSTTGQRESSSPANESGSESGERRHACKQCDSRFKMRGDLLRHVKIVHEGKKMYSCKFCSKKFGHSGHLNRHIQSVHLQQRRFKCDQCGFQFYQASHLQSHMNHIHNGSRKTFECTACGALLKSQTALKNHVAKCSAATRKDETQLTHLPGSAQEQANSSNAHRHFRFQGIQSDDPALRLGAQVLPPRAA